jgi:hypothetical protein
MRRLVAALAGLVLVVGLSVASGTWYDVASPSGPLHLDPPEHPSGDEEIVYGIAGGFATTGEVESGAYLVTDYLGYRRNDPRYTHHPLVHDRILIVVLNGDFLSTHSRPIGDRAGGRDRQVMAVYDATSKRAIMTGYSRGRDPHPFARWSGIVVPLRVSRG